MNSLDLITALGRLLRDGPLRDAFGDGPLAVAEKLGLRESDRPAFLQLRAPELEFQALTLLRKRFEAVRRVIPTTCARLEANAWTSFHDYARNHWPSGHARGIRDAHDFCLHLEQRQPQALSPREWNRLRFALGNKRLAVHWVRGESAERGGGSAVQILVRARRGLWHELALRLQL